MLTAAYFLLMLSRVTHGRSTETVHVPLLAGATAGALPATGPTGAEDDAVTTEASGESPALHRKDGSTAEVGGEKRAGHEDDALRSRGGGEEDLSGAAAPAGGGVAHPPGAASAGRPRMPDVMGYELAAWVPLIALILLFGLWPKALLLLTDPVVRTLVGAP